MLMISLAGHGCISQSASEARPRALRQAQDLPEAFWADRSMAAAPTWEEACYNPMIDPRDQTRLRLVRSARGYGDYETPPGRYGVKADELLRLDCQTGRALGIVKKKE